MRLSPSKATGIADVGRHFCLHIETNIECLLRLADADAQTHRHTDKQAARGPSRAQPTDRSPRRNNPSLPKQFQASPPPSNGAVISLARTHTHTQGTNRNRLIKAETTACFIT
jgi:hypothetical protein